MASVLNPHRETHTTYMQTTTYATQTQMPKRKINTHTQHVCKQRADHRQTQPQTRATQKKQQFIMV
jgi:hypothetical protein